MSDIRVQAAGAPSPVTNGNNQRIAAWGTPEGALNIGSQYDAMVARGRVFIANSGTLTAPTNGADALVNTTPDLLIDVPDGTSIKPLVIQVNFESVGSTAVLECLASASASLGAKSGGSAVTAGSLRTRGGGTTRCTITHTATATAQSTNVIEFFRHQVQLVEDMAATEVGWDDRNYRWVAGVNGPAPLLVGDSSLMIWAASQAASVFITAIWAEFQDNEY